MRGATQDPTASPASPLCSASGVARWPVAVAVAVAVAGQELFGSVLIWRHAVRPVDAKVERRPCRA